MRSRVSQSQDDDDDDDNDNDDGANENEDDENDTNASDHHESSRPSTSTNIRHSSRLTNGSSQVPSTSSLRTTRSSYLHATPMSSAASSLRNDHNYGEGGPSTQQNSSAVQNLRQTRSQIISRHQRNADELDRSGLEDSNLATTSNNRLLRLRSANLRAAPTPSSNFEALNGIRRTTRVRTTHNYFEDENDVEEEEPVVQIQSRVSNRSSRVQDRVQQQSDDSDSYSEEDKTPLKLMQSNSNNKKTHDHNTRNGSSAVNRVKRNLYSDDNSDQVNLLSEKNACKI